MISEKEITKGKQVPDELKENLRILLERVNKLRSLWGKPLIVTNGLRILSEHVEIYRKKAEKLGIVFDMSQVPMGSNHLKALAVDFADQSGEFKKFLKADDYKVLKECELWMESEESTKTTDKQNGWAHVQAVPPKSGDREFNP